MPVSRNLAVDLAAALVGLYTGLIRRLTADMARELAEGIDSPDWAKKKHAALSKLRRRTETMLDRVSRDADGDASEAVAMAYYRGGVEALRETARRQQTDYEKGLRGTRLAALERLRNAAGKRGEAFRDEMNQIRRDLPGVDAIQRLAWTLVSKLKGTHLPILRWQDDVYRKVVAETSLVDVLAGTKTRRRAAQVTWERFLTQGVTGIVYRDGSRRELASYVEMATRTGVAQAAVEGHMDRLADLDIDLVIVSNAPQECAICRPWEGEVLARSGPTGRLQVENALTGAPMWVNVVGTIVEAVAKGLQHPNCRHSLSAFLPGATKPITHTADPQGDADRQRLRELERRLRRAKLKSAAVIDPDAKNKLNAKVRSIQALIRDHVDSTTAKRQPARERIGVARLDVPPHGGFAPPSIRSLPGRRTADGLIPHGRTR